MVNMLMLLMVKKFETINPATGEKLCSVAKCNHKDVDLAVKVSRKAFNSGVWSRCSPEHRKEVLLKFAELLRKHGDEKFCIRMCRYWKASFRL